MSICSSNELVGSPQTRLASRPLTGVGAPGLGNHRKMLHVLQLGPPPMNDHSFLRALWQRCE